MTPFTLPLYVEAHGLPPGPDVETYLLVHGYGASAFTWRYWARPLGRRGHVVVVDLKGFGAAPKPDDGRYAPGDHAEILHRLILQRDLRRLTLVGHSLGGGIALLLALRLLDDDPARIQRLVVVSGAAYPQRMPPFVAMARRRRLSSALMRLLGARRVVRWVLRRVVYDPARVTPGMVEGYAEPLDSPEARRALVESALRILPPDLDEVHRRFPELDVPTLLLWGREDPVIPLWVGERLASELPRARLRVLDGCGHLPPEELPEESLDVLLGFLDEN